MRTTKAILALVAGSFMLAGCGSTNLFNRDRPDEMAVQRQAPLVVPPDFSLTPPQPGAPRPADRTTQQQTLEALFGGTAPRSDIERATIGRAGSSAPAIRSIVGDPQTHTVAKGDVTRDILSAPQGDGREATAAIGG